MSVTTLETESGPVNVSRQSVSRGLYVATLVLFCFPFVEISCQNGDGIETRSRSGLQMALGGHTTTRGNVSRGALTGDRGNPWMTVFAVTIIAGLVISLFSPRRRDWCIAELICTGLAMLALLFQFIFLDTYRSKLGKESFAEYGTTTGRYTFWLLLTFISVTVLFVLALRSLLKIRRSDHAEDDADSVLGTGPFTAVED